jgi:hypothetical protein
VDTGRSSSRLCNHRARRRWTSISKEWVRPAACRGPSEVRGAGFCWRNQFDSWRSTALALVSAPLVGGLFLKVRAARVPAREADANRALATMRLARHGDPAAQGMLGLQFAHGKGQRVIPSPSSFRLPVMDRLGTPVLGLGRKTMFPMSFSRGEVVLLPIPFTDLTHRKMRPAVVIGHSSQTGGLFVVPVSSVLRNVDRKAQSGVRRKLDSP